MALRPGLRGLLAWFENEDVGVWWSHERIRFTSDTVEANGIVARVDLHRNDVLARIPKSACLSHLTTSIAPILTQQGLGGGLALTVAVMIERALGPKSRWHPYFESFGESAAVPVLWSVAELQALRGTELDGVAEEELQTMRDDYEQLVAPLLAAHRAVLPRAGTSFGDFVKAATLVSSRAFYVDEEHGDAMVPLADVFNHRSAVIQLAEGAAIEGYDDDGGGDVDSEQEHDRGTGQAAPGAAEDQGWRYVSDKAEFDRLCDQGPVIVAFVASWCGPCHQIGPVFDAQAKEGGQLDFVKVDVDEAEEIVGAVGVESMPTFQVYKGGRKLAQFSGNKQGLLLATVAEFRGAGRASKRRRLSEPPGNATTADDDDDDDDAAEFALNTTDYPLNIAICGHDDVPPGHLEIVMAHPTKRGDEIFNTYGELSNGSLIMKYGFAELDNPHDIANVTAGQLEHALGLQDWAEQHHAARLEEVLNCDGVFEDPELFEISLGGGLPLELVFAVHFAVTDDQDARRRYHKGALAAAAAADMDRMLLCRRTRQVLVDALVARLDRLATHSSTRPTPASTPGSQAPQASLARARASLERHRDQLARVVRRGATRSWSRRTALALRIREQTVLIAALEIAGGSASR